MKEVKGDMKQKKGKMQGRSGKGRMERERGKGEGKAVYRSSSQALTLRSTQAPCLSIHLNHHAQQGDHGLLHKQDSRQ